MAIQTKPKQRGLDWLLMAGVVVLVIVVIDAMVRGYSL